MDEIAARINAAFRAYGLDHDVVKVQHDDLIGDRLSITDCRTRATMSLLADTIEYLVACHSGQTAEESQLRMF